MDLDNISVLDLQTSFMKSDKTTQALCFALDKQFKQISEEFKLVLIYCRVNDLDEVALDELAWQMHVDFYKHSLSLDKKKELIKNSLRWHKIKGTPAAVEEVISTIFGRSKIEEWFEYGGEPFFFRVNVDASKQGASKEDLDMLENLINEYKNKRSWLEVINIFLTSSNSAKLGGYSNTGEEIIIYPWRVTESKSTGPISFAIGFKSLETLTIYPKEEI